MNINSVEQIKQQQLVRCARWQTLATNNVWLVMAVGGRTINQTNICGGWRSNSHGNIGR